MNERLNKVEIQLSYLPLVNFAMQQNRTPVIHQITIENITDEPLKDLRIEIIPEPDFASSVPASIEEIPPRGSLSLTSFNLTLSAGYFARLTERLSGSLNVGIYSGTEPVFGRKYPIDLLAYDQWGGINVFPQMLSAYITPNHPALSPILHRAASILEEWTGNPSLNEYQSRNPDRAKKQMAAVYNAIAEQSVIYSAPPAGFETNGQRIRLANTVVSQKLGTCLDMALLYASCLESIGIHPLIILTKGHAFAGGWLVPETFPDSIVDDSSLLTKRTAEGICDITLVETTCMNPGQRADFDHAVKAANDRLIGSENFLCALDVKRARLSGVRPIPQQTLNGENREIKEQEEDNAPVSVHATPQSVSRYDLSGENTGIVMTKQLLWERRLLDLSLRNNLLNIRATKNTLQLIPTDFASLEDALAGGGEFQILHRPADWENPAIEFGIYSTLHASDPVTELVKSELAQKRLRSYLTENDLAKALTHLYRASRMSIEENGANTLYLAVGLLKWYETAASERPRYAPVLLLPIDIIRKSAAKGYVIRLREEETMMNITLLEMLRQNFGITIPGLDPLPADDNGVDVKRIYSLIRNSIKNQRKWDVEEQAMLGIFSFNKFIMWNDIHNNSSKLAKNKIVSSLIDGKIKWDVAAEQEADAASMDKKLSPADILLPISADSSQLEAVYEAVHDKTFILHGPPGTGKSQTITNIIANALYRGKRVLFVAEKMAALAVVEKRMNRLGLGAFCLELHSNKMQKSAIISQLKETTELLKQRPPEEFRKEAERLAALRKELGEYIDALHKEYPFGLSLYEAVVGEQSLDTEASFRFPPELLETLDKEKLSQWKDEVELLVRTANAGEHPHRHPLTGIQLNSYSLDSKEEAARLFAEFTDLLHRIQAKTSSFSILLKGMETPDTREGFRIWNTIVQKINETPELTPELLTTPRLKETLDGLHAAAVHGRQRDAFRTDIERDFLHEILNINAAQLLNEWERVSGQWFLPRYFGQKKIKKAISPFALNPIANDEIKGILHRIKQYREEAAFVERHKEELSARFGKYGREEDWDAVDQIIDSASSIHSLLLSYTKDAAKTAEVKQALATRLSEGVDVFRDIHASEIRDLLQLSEALSAMEQKLGTTLGISAETLYGDSGGWTDRALAQTKTWTENLHRLKEWYQWLEAVRKLEASGIGFVAREYAERPIPTDELNDRFRKSLYRDITRHIISKEPKLELFNGRIFNDVIAKYKQVAAEFEKITRKELFAKLASNIPSFTQEAIQNSEVGILQKNIRNNARGISIRKLFDQIPTLLPRMCPCMLMSPLSVAQYIDADADLFDLVVFDEASQMPTYEAVGAIARGKNVVVVGDPKQMPPTNFFSVNMVDEENIELEDLESILDDCLALSIPSKYLQWHYRSRHESLIAFSNSEFYDNRLMTFPAPDNIESKVKMVAIEGHYDKGKTRQNRAEAQAVVDEIARRLRDEELRKRSIGVVTFSIVQQALIEDLLSDLFIAHPELETLALECEEPLFIKNLENVQGDERDVILFSIGYGPDAEGRVSMNFGPLNRLGGERRLNVAVSRSRYEMLIFSTLRSDMIDLNRTSSVGVAGLKRFLEYAEKGTRSALNTYTSRPSDRKISIEEIIAEKLRTMGYTVHTDIGYSGYKIDIGIVDREHPQKYRVGIICDGKNYRQTKTVRDREIVQNGVLKGLGWNICRIWTMDWWEKPDEVIASIQRAMENGHAADDMPPARNEEKKSVSPPRIAGKEISGSANSQSRHEENGREEYTEAKLTPGKYPSDKLAAPRSASILASQVRKIIACEAPISKTLLSKKVLSEWGINRIVQRAEFPLAIAFDESNLYRTFHGELVIFWKSEEQYRTYSAYRPDSGRDAADLPPEEVANAIRQLVKDSISLPLPDLIKGGARLFGFTRMGTNIEAAIRRGIQEASARGFINIENDRVMMPEA